MPKKNLLHSRNGRFATFGLLYISEGIPYGFTSAAMVTFMRQEGVSLDLIGAFTAALFIPWSLKVLWAPFIDLVPLRRLGGRKAWILICLTMMILTLVATAMVDFKENFRLLLAMVVLNNLFCATQDVAIDSLAVSTLKKGERGRGNGFMFGGQYLGIAMGGGGAIFISGLYGFEVSLLYAASLLALMWLFVLLLVRDPALERPAAPRSGSILTEIGSFIVTLVRSFVFSGSGVRYGIVFALLPVGTSALAYGLLKTIKVDYGFNDFEIAELSVYNTVLGGLGCVFGGFIGDRFGMKRALWLFYAATALPTLFLAMQISALGLQGVPGWQMYAVIMTHGCIFGMAYGVRSAVYMGMTNPVVAATQFTGFMALANVAISTANLWQGNVAENFGYARVLYIDSLILILTLALIPLLGDRKVSELQKRAGETARMN